LVGPNVTNYDKYLSFHFDLQDEYLLSSTIWLWKENSQDSWGLYDRVGDKWVERQNMVNIVSRDADRRHADDDAFREQDADVRLRKCHLRRERRLHRIWRDPIWGDEFIGAHLAVWLGTRIELQRRSLGLEGAPS
jgi:hypothetical protein